MSSESEKGTVDAEFDRLFDLYMQGSLGIDVILEVFNK